MLSRRSLLAAKSGDDSPNPENYELIYLQEKRIHELEALNVGLRRQLVGDRRAFEQEKEELLSQHGELYSTIDSADLFHLQLCAILEIDRQEKSNFPLIIQSIHDLVQQDVANASQLTEAIATREAQLIDLDHNLKELRSLYQQSEVESAAKSLEVEQLRSQAESQETQLHAILALTNSDTADASLGVIRRLKVRVREYKRAIREQQAENAELGEIRQMIAEQSEVLATVVQALKGRGLRVRQTAAPAVGANGFVDFGGGFRYDDIRNTMWIAKTKDLLSLERQFAKANKRFNAANSHVQRLMRQAPQHVADCPETYI
jgi:hypothetical protein